MHVRPLTQEDVAAADEVARDALYRPDLGTDIEARRARRAAADRAPPEHRSRRLLRGRGRRRRDRRAVDLADPRGRVGLLAVRGGRARPWPRARARAVRRRLGLRPGAPRGHIILSSAAPRGDAPLRPDRAAAAAVHRGRRDRRPQPARPTCPRCATAAPTTSSSSTRSGASCAGPATASTWRCCSRWARAWCSCEDRAFALYRGPAGDPRRRPRRRERGAGAVGRLRAHGPRRDAHASTSSPPARTGPCRRA